MDVLGQEDYDIIADQSISCIRAIHSNPNYNR